MKFDTKIAVVLREDLATWQKLNVTAFTVSGIAGTVPEVMGENYQDASGNIYLPMLRQPVLVFGANIEQIARVYERAMNRNVRLSIFTEDLFSTGNDDDNRAAVRSKPRQELRLVGMAMRDQKKVIDKVLDGLSLYR